MSSTDVAVQQPAIKTQLEKYRGLLPEDRQLSWLQLGYSKATIKEKMESHLLSLQPLLLDYETKPVKELQDAIDKYKAGLKTIPELRKSFTKYLDKIAQELMTVEKKAEGFQLSADGKRWEPIPDFTLVKAEKRLLELKEQLEVQNNAATLKANEATNFKTHVKNEYIRIAGEYESKLLDTITTSYTQALKDGTLTEDGLKQYVDVTIKALADVKPASPAKFEFQYWDKKTELDAILKMAQEFKPADYQKIFNQYVLKMRERFMMYWNDVKNKEKATEVIQQQAAQTKANLEEKATTAMSVNALVGKGTAAVTITDPEIKPIKRTWQIVIKDNDPAWVKKVLSEFLARFDSCAPRLRIKQWSNLSVKQMAVALQEEDEQISGLDYIESKK